MQQFEQMGKYTYLLFGGELDERIDAETIAGNWLA